MTPEMLQLLQVLQVFGIVGVVTISLLSLVFMFLQTFLIVILSFHLIEIISNDAYFVK